MDIATDTALASESEQLRRVQAVTDAALAHLGLDDLLNALLERTRELLDADTAAILLLDTESGELVANAAKGIEEEVRQGVRIPFGRGFAGRIAAERRPVIIDHVDHDTVINPILIKKGIRSMVGVPLIADGVTLGVLHVGTLHSRSFSRDDSALLQLVADRAALAIRAGISMEERAAAATLQRSLAPRRLPEIVGLELAGRYIPGLSGAVGGDWFDVFELPDGRVGVAIGDIAGHGLRAAVVMGHLRSALHAYALASDDPASVLTRLDEMVCHFEPDEMATILYAVYDPVVQLITLSTAGHPGPVMAEPGTPAYSLPLHSDPPVGSGFGVERRASTAYLPAGASLYLFTDGVVERRGIDITTGIDRLCAAATAGPPHDGCTSITSELLDDEPADDFALLALHVTAGSRGRAGLTLGSRPSGSPLNRDSTI